MSTLYLNEIKTFIILCDYRRFFFSGSVYVKVPSSINVVEEEKLRIQCRVLGSPHLTWIFSKLAIIITKREKLKLNKKSHLII